MSSILQSWRIAARRRVADGRESGNADSDRHRVGATHTQSPARAGLATLHTHLDLDSSPCKKEGSAANTTAVASSAAALLVRLREGAATTRQAPPVGLSEQGPATGWASTNEWGKPVDIKAQPAATAPAGAEVVDAA